MGKETHGFTLVGYLPGFRQAAKNLCKSKRFEGEVMC